jgi:hypothetical protein
MRWTRWCRKTCGRSRTVKPCGSGSPMLESSLRDGDIGPSVRDAAQAMVANKPGTPGRARSSRKTIAQGMPCDFGLPVLTCGHLSFSAHRACGCGQRPAFPAPSVFWRDDVDAKSGRKSRRGGAVACSSSLRGAKRRSNPPLHLRHDGLLRFARNDDGMAAQCRRAEKAPTK